MKLFQGVAEYRASTLVLVLAVGSSLFFVALLVFGKIAIDLGLHLRSHQKLMAKVESD